MEESVRTLFESNPVPMLVIDCGDLKFLAVNDAAVRHYGYTREQFLTMTMLDILPPEDRQHYAVLFRAYRESERLEFDSATVRRHRRADGSERHSLVPAPGARLAPQLLEPSEPELRERPAAGLARAGRREGPGAGEVQTS